MLMVIFGAGASYDSFGELPASDPAVPVNAALNESRLPLARELFSRRFGHIAQKNPNCQSLVARLRSILGTDGTSVEQALEEIQEQARAYPAMPRQLLSLRYYIREEIEWAQRQWSYVTSDITNYHVLLDVLQIWGHDHSEHVALVTFNYDTLLDLACAASFGLDTAELSAFIGSPTFSYYKVHGSTDWWRVVRGVEKSVYESAARMEYTREFRKNVDNFNVMNGETVIPAIAIPTSHKLNFECPESHLRRLEQVIPNVTRLLIVGWHGVEEHFLGLWPPENTSLQRVGIVDRSDDDVMAVYGNLKRVAGSRRIELRAHPFGFSHFVSQLDNVRAFLS